MDTTGEDTPGAFGIQDFLCAPLLLQNMGDPGNVLDARHITLANRLMLATALLIVLPDFVIRALLKS